jgi:cell division protein FtsI (penicillin-binding protein 3)
MNGKRVDRPSAFRIYVLVGIFTLLLLGLMVRLFAIQVLQHRHLAELAERQHQRAIELRGKRGTIYDRRGRELALSVNRESVYVNPNEFSENPETVALLARTLGLKEAALVEKIHSDRQFVWLKRKIPPQETAALRSLGIKGVGHATESQRFYPKQGLAAQVIGFVGTDDAGLEGIEHAYESTLTGEAVRVVLDRDARGRPIALRADTLRELPRGHDLVLTLDERLQFVAERELRAQVAKVGARGGVAIVMEPSTGEILALANESVFDANHLRDFSPKHWRERSTADTFEPGSTLKAVVAAAALEERLVKPDEMFFGEQGSIQVAGVSIRDHEKFGWLTFREVLEKSSNVGAIKVGQRLGKDRLYTYLERFGFGSRTGIDFPGEAPGLLRHPQQWSDLSLASLAIGQELAVTPLQLVTAFSAIANGGVLMRPYLVKSVTNAAEVVQEVTPFRVRRVLSEATARQVTALLQGVVSHGTGKAAAVEGYTVAGKTGSAQKFDAALGKYSSQKTVASFVGYLPAEHPRVAILVSLDEPQVAMAWGGIAAAPTFSAIAQQAMRYLHIPPDDGQTRILDSPMAKRERQITSPSVVTLSAGNLVENVREMIRSSLDQMAGYVRVHFMSVDAKEARKPRKKVEKSPR